MVNALCLCDDHIQESVGTRGALLRTPRNRVRECILTRFRKPRSQGAIVQPVRTNQIEHITTDYNQQLQSSLFNRIPGEIRNEIFAIALTSFDDKAHPYKQDSYYCRPGYRYKQRIDTSLLSTCRRVYVETYLLPVIVNEHVFWCYRGPDGSLSDPRPYFNKMSERQKDAVQRVHFFAQLFWLGKSFRWVCTVGVMRPKSIKLTIRHSDWWFWEKNTRLRMEENWGLNLKELVGLEELVVELETMERDIDQLEAIAETMMSWRFNLHDGRFLSTEGNDIVRYHWLGPSCYEGSLRYSAETDKWEEGQVGSTTSAQRSRSSVPPDLAVPPPLRYHVLTLRWLRVKA